MKCAPPKRYKKMKAVEYFMTQGFSCCESIVKWGIDEGLCPPEVLSAATAFSGGMGSGCLCGAVAGAQIIIGSQFGRDNKYGNEYLGRVKAKELIQKFTEKHKATCCRVLTRGMDMASPERKAHCANMVEECENLVKEVLGVNVAK